jgi:hypothetical protein
MTIIAFFFGSPLTLLLILFSFYFCIRSPHRWQYAWLPSSQAACFGAALFEATWQLASV